MQRTVAGHSSTVQRTVAGHSSTVQRTVAGTAVYTPSRWPIYLLTFLYCFLKHGWSISFWYNGRTERKNIKEDRQCACERNIQALLLDHSCRGTAVTIIFSECLSVAFGIQHAILICHISICSLYGPTIFSKLSHKWRDFKRKNIISSSSGVLLEKLTGSLLVNNFRALYGTQRFITAFTSACHLSLSWAISMKSTLYIPLPEGPS